MTLRLELGATVLDFEDWADHGVIVSSVDLGFPSPREVITALPGQDGQDDETAYSSTRLVTISGLLTPVDDPAGPDRSFGIRALMPFMAPAARPRLVYGLSGTSEDHVLTLRASDWTAPIVNPQTLAFQASWKCADPIAYGVTVDEVDIAPTAIDPTGRSYPLAFPRTYPGSLGGSGRFVVTNGDYPTWPMLRFFGPCTVPALTWLDPVTAARLGPAVVFTGGTTVSVGNYLEVDTRAQTVTLNGDPTADRLNLLDFSQTLFGPLAAGANLLLFGAATASSPSTCAVLWSDAYIL